MKLRSRRILAGVAAVAATVSGSVAVAVAANAGSGQTPRLLVNTTSMRGAAGTCQVLLVTPSTTFGTPSAATETVTLKLSESPSAGDQDIDFCVSSQTDPSYRADTPSEDPHYDNGTLQPNPAVPGSPTYKAGPSITNSASNAGGNPDEADNSAQTAPAATPGKYATSNPNGVDWARYTYNGQTQQPIRVGVVGLTTGSATIKAWIDDNRASTDTAYVPDTDETQADLVTFNITPGGTPGSVPAYEAVSKLTADPTDDAAPAGVAQPFTASLVNNQGDPVRGVRPLIQVTGPNAGANATCDDSDNNGVSRCSYTGTTPGTDTLTVYVNRSNGTAGPDFGETRAVITRTVTKPAVPAANARYIDLTPKTQTVTSGQSDTFTATVTDVNGAPAQGVTVNFTESGPGSFSDNSGTYSVTTDPTGRARVKIVTLSTEAGTENITATIGTAGTECTQQAGGGAGANPSTPAGRCTDTATNTISNASPSPSATPSATPTGSGRPTPTQSLTLSLDSPSTITPGVDSLMTARGTPGATVVLRCYSRTPENSAPGTGTPPYFDARTNTLDSGGSFQFALHPGTNTRCFVKYAGASDSDTRNSVSIVQNVATNLSLSAYRDGVRKYHFQGTNLPRRSGQLITLYRYATGANLDKYCVPAPESYSPQSSSGCTAVRTATAYTNSTNVWRIDRTFTGSGQFYFVVRTSSTLTNVAGFSNQRLTIIH